MHTIMKKAMALVFHQAPQASGGFLIIDKL
jgi:hypothetical protein